MKPKINRNDFLAVTLLLIAVLAFWRAYVTHKYVLPYDGRHGATDLYDYFYPKWVYGNEILKTGHAPLWDPYSYCGIPFMASLQEEVFYPIKFLLFAAFPLRAAIQVYVTCHMFLNGLFTYLLLRTLGISRLGSFLAALAWSASALAATGSMYHPIRLASIAWTPFCLLALHKLLTKRETLWSVMLAIGVAMQFLAGMPEFTMENAAFLLLYYICFVATTRLPSAREIPKHLFQTQAMVILSAALCLLLVAIQLIPFLELLSLSHRSEGVATVLLRSFGAIYNMSTIKWGGNIFSPLLITYGCPILVLAFYGATFSKKSAKWFFILGGAFAFLMGFHMSFNSFFHDYPPFKYNRFPFTWRIVLPFFFTCLAGIGIDYLRNTGSSDDSPAEGRRSKLSGRDTIAVAAIYCFVMFMALDFDKMDLHEILAIFSTAAFVSLIIFARTKTLKTMAAMLLTFWAVVLFVVFSPQGREKIRLPQESLEELKDSPLGPIAKSYVEDNKFARYYSIELVSRGNFLHSGVSLIAGAGTPIKIRRAAHIYELYKYRRLKSLRTENWDAFIYQRTFLNLMGTAIVFVPPRMAELFSTEGSGYELIEETDEYVAFENKRALPRAFLVHKALVIKDETEIFETFRDGCIDPAETVIIEEDIPDSMLSSYPTDDEEAPQITTYLPEEVIIQANPTEAAFLVLTDSYFPGWKAYDNGRETHIYRADYMFRAIHLTPGEHVIRFSYEPASFKWGLRLSIIGWLIVAAYFAYRISLLFSKKSPRKSGASPAGSNGLA